VATRGEWAPSAVIDLGLYLYWLVSSTRCACSPALQLDETSSELAIPPTMGTIEQVEAAIKASRLQVRQFTQIYTNTDCYLTLSALGS
jgi:hypothetical protein